MEMLSGSSLDVRKIKQANDVEINNTAPYPHRFACEKMAAILSAQHAIEHARRFPCTHEEGANNRPTRFSFLSFPR